MFYQKLHAFKRDGRVAHLQVEYTMSKLARMKETCEAGCEIKEGEYWHCTMLYACLKRKGAPERPSYQDCRFWTAVRERERESANPDRTHRLPRQV